MNQQNPQGQPLPEKQGAPTPMQGVQQNTPESLQAQAIVSQMQAQQQGAMQQQAAPQAQQMVQAQQQQQQQQVEQQVNQMQQAQNVEQQPQQSQQQPAQIQQQAQPQQPQSQQQMAQPAPAVATGAADKPAESAPGAGPTEPANSAPRPPRHEVYQTLERLGATLLFEQVLSTGTLERVIVSKEIAEQHFPKLEPPTMQQTMKVTDTSGVSYDVTLRGMTSNNQIVYVLEGISPILQTLNIGPGDVFIVANTKQSGIVVAARHTVQGGSIQTGPKRIKLAQQVSNATWATRSRFMSQAHPPLDGVFRCSGLCDASSVDQGVWKLENIFIATVIVDGEVYEAAFSRHIDCLEAFNAAGIPHLTPSTPGQQAQPAATGQTTNGPVPMVVG